MTIWALFGIKNCEIWTKTYKYIGSQYADHLRPTHPTPFRAS